MSDVFKDVLNVVTLGIAGSILDKPSMPDAPDLVEQQTGQVVESKAGKGLEDEEESKTTARRTARKGTAQFRIPLAASTTGVKTAGTTGISI